MKIVVTGSLGNIGKPLTETLVKKGHSVAVISSKPGKQKEIEALGAQAAIGSIKDAAFLNETFRNADAVYGMVPPNFGEPDPIAYYERVGRGYADAIRHAGVKRLVHLSSYGAHLEKGAGFITGSNRVEKILDAVPDIALTHVRPGYFYYNLLSFIGMIKGAGFIGSVYGGNDKLILVSPTDIAMAIAEELLDMKGARKIRYVISDERTCAETAQILGQAIGIPHLQWKTLPPEQVLQTLLTNGMPQGAVAMLIELGLGIHTGRLLEDYEKNKPEALGKVKLEEFAQTFAKVYKQ